MSTLQKPEMPDSPLKKARMQKGETLQAVADAIGTDTGNLSRIERGKQTPSKEIVEKLVKHFNNAITEIQIFYPERFADVGSVASAGSAN